MAKSSTTHVIEIETGIGEPAFIPLTLGNETQPISVGKKGMWRIESARVLDIHAFVYFDGNALFMQSADEEASATVDGYKIGKAWTELHAPCKIEIGAARLRYRSLLPESEDPVTAAIPVGKMQSEMQATGPQIPPPPRPPPPSAQSAPTMAEDVDEPTPVTRNEPIPRDEPTRNESLRDESPRSQRPPASSASPSTPAGKPERPFRPGAFSVSDADENTRWKPVEGGASANPASRPAPPQQSMQAMQAMQMTGPVQALPDGAYSPIGHGPMQPAPSMPPMMVQGSMPPVMQPPSMAPGSQMSGVPSGTMHIPGNNGPGVPHGTMNTGPTGPMQMPGQGYASGGYPTSQGYLQHPQGAPAPPMNSVQQFVATFKSWNPVKKAAMILLPISLLLGIVSLFDSDPQTPAPHAKVDAGPPKVASSDLPVWPAGVPCPPPNWPPETPLPCRPNGVVVVPQPTVAVVTASDGGASSPTFAPAGKASLQRQAVDAVVQGDIPRAASLYEELARREPNVTVYAESARILRAKLAAGAGAGGAQ